MNDVNIFSQPTIKKLKTTKNLAAWKIILYVTSIILMIVGLALLVTRAIDFSDYNDGITGEQIRRNIDEARDFWKEIYRDAQSFDKQFVEKYLIPIILFASTLVIYIVNVILSIALLLSSNKLNNTEELKNSDKYNPSSFVTLAVLSLIFQFLFTFVSFIFDIVLVSKTRKTLKSIG
ncbi:amino acid transporter [Mycoplasmoides fastidiosum]|uniref:Amino acid transporter n=1 Tax=Mycoplasmoides fastidiosum TaxID=92758 RepID=A0ABU0LZ00_9BACT|nr:hypothetical protein [Mycoplasmoides fastidiosum]MDQ0513931.1 amino acid transporter [Mycoplasmoides fastidiosum]UUD37655.1 hypothetical protein NPA10_03750 [Mycoplasmoides fastidiosum]